MKNKVIAMVLTAAAAVCVCSGCGSRSSRINENLDTSKAVTLKLCGPWAESKALETVSQEFCEKYSNCNIEYEYVQNYNDSLSTRFEKLPQSIDLFLTENIQSDSPFFPYAEELFSHKELDLSDTNEALIKNFSLIKQDKDEEDKLYSIPLGGELRGLFVNKTLLSSLDIEVPKNSKELLSACEKLKEAGYVPMNGNPGMFGQRLLYPYVCNLIANSKDYNKTYKMVNECEDGVSELFREPMEMMYTLVENSYYNYKYVETELQMFTDNSDEGCARDFIGIKKNGSEFTKTDDMGKVAFMIGTWSLQSVIDKMKEDYHSGIDYEFILSPVSDEGGFAYVSPSKGIAVNKSSENKEWAIEFMNFLFEKDINTKLADEFHCIPNTAKSFAVIKEKFNIPSRRISDLGKATFDYSFYNIINQTLISISKGNNPKYMDTGADGSAVMYSFDYYMQQLEDAFAAQREAQAD